jgi:biotin operon repressor
MLDHLLGGSKTHLRLIVVLGLKMLLGISSSAVEEMIQHLAAIYVNLNKVHNVRYNYNRLIMKPS